MIHPSAIIDPKAELASDVEVGPWTLIGPGVQIDAGTRIASHVVIKGPTRIGRDNRIFQFASVGDDPQDKKYAGEPTRLEIGDGNVIRESCTINRGTEQGGGVTRVGDDNWIMAYCHIAHDCQVGDHTIFANNASLAGHVEVGDWAILGGFSAIHQFVAIGAHSFLSMCSVVRQDVPPYVTVAGDSARARGLNSEGLRRRGFSDRALRQLREAYRILFRRNLTLADALEQLRVLAGDSDEVRLLVDFLERTSRGIVR
ncbi:acyl-ACP--UDP-N-acetylglucosamine O-acyltransferase [Thioalbus denitrificans]|uniref:Acyl-[acyl-carrier-protein]--UDP-N-acetylglucosamine O-acyltransferase n=1 Tax=Thioalbus denitrificans TaxID=547122 RepID=A0A369BYX7_9GAMM|nr:acyl-ACP--UDP-N-acetylglucosamine O-acyltransferase [Thioalbus denitrificans]RCX24834.1 acyl-[acyl-carrier-protein]--UDP-N-acetylglucosamine O-acyltransferase [Thioalbus denitrificans]